MERIAVKNWDRLDFVELLRKSKCKLGVEVGTYNGEFASMLERAMPELKLTCVDPYKEQGDNYLDIANNSQEVQDLRYLMVRKLLRGKVLRQYSKDACQCFEDGSLDLVYIDANHEYESVYEDILLWRPKVKKGGILSGHDYSWTHHGVRNAVKELVAVDHNVCVFGRDDIWCSML